MRVAGRSDGAGTSLAKGPLGRSVKGSLEISMWAIAAGALCAVAIGQIRLLSTPSTTRWD
jgi:hypothetical protein